MRQFAKKLASSKRGATAIEYGLIVALVAISILTAVKSVADGTISMWSHVEEEIVDAVEN